MPSTLSDDETAAEVNNTEMLNQVLPVSTMQRLAFTRYLYTVGVEQSQHPEPLAAIAVLSFHDSVELFLHLAAEHKNVEIGKRTRKEFAEYFGLIDAELTPGRLSQRLAMVRLNETRVALKHHGTLPSRLAIEQLRSDVARFFEDNTALVFGLMFQSVSLVDIVACGPAREKLIVAEAERAAGMTESSMCNIALAFAQLVDDYEDRVRSRYGRSPFVFGDSFTLDSSFHRGRHPQPLSHNDQGQFEDKLMNSIIALQDAMKVLNLGIDYRRYAKFRLLTPVVRRYAGGSGYSVQVVAGFRGQAWPPSAAACRFCIDFVIDTAIRLQDVDFDLEEM